MDTQDELRQLVFARGGDAIDATSAARTLLRADEKLLWAGWAKLASIKPIIAIIGGAALLVVSFPIMFVLILSLYRYSQTGVFKFPWDFLCVGLGIAGLFTGFCALALRSADVRLLQIITEKRVMLFTLLKGRQFPRLNEAAESPPPTELSLGDVQRVEIYLRRNGTTMVSFVGPRETIGFPEVQQAPRELVKLLPENLRSRVQIGNVPATDITRGTYTEPK